MKCLVAVLLLFVTYLLPAQILTQGELEYLVGDDPMYSSLSARLDSIIDQHNDINWIESLENTKDLFDQDSSFGEFIYEFARLYRFNDPHLSLKVLGHFESIFIDEDSNERLAAMLGLKAVILMLANRPSEALEVAFKGLGYLDSVTNKETYYTNLSNTCIIYQQLNDYETPVEIMNRVLANTDEQTQGYNYYSRLYNQALNYYYLEQYDTAIFIYKRVLNYEPFFNDVGWAYTHAEIARVYKKKADYSNSIFHANKALGWALKNANRQKMIDCFSTLATSYAGAGYRDSAIYYMAKSREEVFAQDLNLDKRTFYKMQMNTYQLLGDFEQAFEAAKSYNEMDIEIAGDKARSAREQFETQYLTAEKEAENATLKAQNQQQQFALIGGIILIVFLAGIGVYIYRSNQKTKALYAQLSAQAFELNKANKTKDRLFSIIGHDLRGPITSFETANTLIKNYLERKDTAKVDAMVDQVGKSVKSLKMLLDNLLNWSLGQQGELDLNIQSLEAKPIIEEIFEVLQEPARFKRITLQHNLTDDKVLADRDTITTVFRNLISNAIKFSPEESEIVVEKKQDGNYLSINVIDQGMGMEQGQLDKLFEVDKSKVRRGTANEKGSGLGLVLVKEFVEINNGLISVNSEPGGGSSFEVRLPVAS